MTPLRRWLWITAELPDLLATGRMVYSAGLAGALSHRVDVVMVGLTAGSARPPVSRVVAVDQPMRASWRSIVSPLPNLAFTCSPRAVRAAVRNLLEQSWDVVVVDHLQSAWVLDELRRHHDGAVVFVTHNHEASVRREAARELRGASARSLVLTLDAWKAARLEQRALRIAHVVTSITEEDRQRFVNEAPGTRHVLVAPGWSGETSRVAPPMSQRPRRVGILGSFEWHVKQENLRRFLPDADAVLAAAGVEITVAGNVPDRLRASLEPTLRATRFVGWVDSTSDFLDECRVAVVAEPLGGGFKMKTLDYVFAGVPIAAVRGSIAGLPLTPPASMIQGDDASDLARAIVAVIDDDEELTRLANAAFERCATAFSWESRADDLVAAVGGIGVGGRT